MIKKVVVSGLLLLFTFNVFGQQESFSNPTGFRISVMPKLNSPSSIKGVLPAGLFLQKYTPSVNFALGFDLPIRQKWHLVIGVEYQTYRQKSRLLIDYQGDSMGYFGIWNVKSSEFPAPQLGLSYDLKLKDLTFQIGSKLGYRYTNAPYWSYGDENNFVNGFGEQVNIKRTTLIQPLEGARWMNQVSFNVKSGGNKNLTPSVGLVYQFSEPNSRISEIIEIDNRKYSFSQKRNTSFFGINVQLTFHKAKKHIIS